MGEWVVPAFELEGHRRRFQLIVSTFKSRCFKISFSWDKNKGAFEARRGRDGSME